MEKRDEELDATRRMYKDMFDKPGGKHLHMWLINQRNNMRDKAEKENDPMTAYGMLKEAKGVNIVIEHIKAMIRDE